MVIYSIGAANNSMNIIQISLLHKISTITSLFQIATYIFEDRFSFSRSPESMLTLFNFTQTSRSYLNNKVMKTEQSKNF